MDLQYNKNNRRENLRNYYEILEVNPKASLETIQKIYKYHIKKWHPDLYQGEKKIEAEHKTKEFNEAYKVLSNSTSRSSYDEILKNAIVQEEIESLKQENENLKNTLKQRDMLIQQLLYEDISKQEKIEEEKIDSSTISSPSQETSADAEIHKIFYEILVKGLLILLLIFCGVAILCYLATRFFSYFT